MRIPFRRATGHRKRTRHHRDTGGEHDRAIEGNRYRSTGFVVMPERVHLTIYPLAGAASKKSLRFMGKPPEASVCAAPRPWGRPGKSIGP